MKILCDMDGVQCDFITAAMALFNVAYDRREWPLGQFDVAPLLGVDHATFWQQIADQGSTWWEYLDAYPWLAELLTLVRTYDPEFCVATHPGKNLAGPLSAAGKLRWLSRETPDVVAADRYFLCGRKFQLANRNTVLIDDNEDVCRRFVHCGGFAILFPQPWNSNGHLWDSRLQHVANALETIQKTERPAVMQ